MISNKIIAKEFFMELVYLWVEDYKNIQKQGFNSQLSHIDSTKFMN